MGSPYKWMERECGRRWRRRCCMVLKLCMVPHNQLNPHVQRSSGAQSYELVCGAGACHNCQSSLDRVSNEYICTGERTRRGLLTRALFHALLYAPTKLEKECACAPSRLLESSSVGKSSFRIIEEENCGKIDSREAGFCGFSSTN